MKKQDARKALESGYQQAERAFEKLIHVQKQIWHNLKYCFSHSEILKYLKIIWVKPLKTSLFASKVILLHNT